MGVTPKLVGGAWVGGEYRSIHFRTGALGQGSRTALPIFGYFIQDVLKDERFSKYRQKFAPPRDLDASLWTCSGYYAQPNDSTDTDSLDIETELGVEQELENGAVQETEDVNPTPEEVLDE